MRTGDRAARGCPLHTHLCSSLHTGVYAAGATAGVPSARIGVPAAAASARTRASSAASSSHTVTLVALWTK